MVFTLTAQMASPRQASNLYSVSGRFPKQKHSFLVRFNRAVGPSPNVSPTFAAKSCDRPQVQPVAEELNQYGKRRHVYTGIKYNAVKISLYDTADGAAQRMWLEYAQYYFGDFKSGTTVNSYLSDTVSGTFHDNNKTGFGFTANNGGRTGDQAQFFFTSIDILHFNNAMYDQYTLIHPRIVAYSPDDLDYESAAISMVNFEFAYEAVQFIPASNAARGETVPELSLGQNPNLVGDVSGIPSNLPRYSAQNGPSAYATPSYSNLNPTSALTDSIVSSLASGNGSALANLQATLANYRYVSSGGSGSALQGIWGNYSYGVTPAPTNNPTIGALAAANPQFAAMLQGISPGNPITAGSAATGISPALGASAASVTGAFTPGATGPAVSSVTAGVLAANATGVPGLVQSNAGVQLSPQAYGIINAQGSGTSQYGFNNQASAGGSYGADSAAGYQGPQQPAYANSSSTVAPAGSLGLGAPTAAGPNTTIYNTTMGY